MKKHSHDFSTVFLTFSLLLSILHSLKQLFIPHMCQRINYPSLFSICVLITLILFPLEPAASYPYTPESENIVLQTIPEYLAKPPPMIGGASFNLEEQFLTVNNSLTEFHRSGDDGLIRKAELLLSLFPPSEQESERYLNLKATILQARHNFNGALTILSLLIRKFGDSKQAWFTRAMILLSQGEISLARQSCSQLLRLGDPIAVELCSAAVNSVSGRSISAIASLKRILQKDEGVDSQLRSWAFSLLGETQERIGNLQEAEDAYKSALAIDPRSVYILTTYADLLLFQERYQEVIDQLSSNNTADGLLLRLAIAFKKLQPKYSSEFKSIVTELGEKKEAATLRGEKVHLREQAMLSLTILENSKEALNLAKENFEIQREPTDALVLGKAAKAAGDAETLNKLRLWKEGNQLEDLRLSRILGE